MSVIALLTDFGTDDYFVGAMKGVILGINPNVTIVDITHNIRPQDVRSAAFTLGACWRDFPAGAILVAVVDPGVGTDRRAILVNAEGKYFIGPDNGILSFVLEGRDVRVIELSNARYFREDVSTTFHGRDVFAPVAAHLSTGIELTEFGHAINDPLVFPGFLPTLSGGRIEGEIIHIDRFGNLITSLKPGDMPARFAIQVGNHRITRLAKTFGDADPGEVVAIVGSAGYVEIAANLDSAARTLGVGMGEKVTVSAD